MGKLSEKTLATTIQDGDRFDVSVDNGDGTFTSLAIDGATMKAILLAVPTLEEVLNEGNDTGSNDIVLRAKLRSHDDGTNGITNSFSFIDGGGCSQTNASSDGTDTIRMTEAWNVIFPQFAQKIKEIQVGNATILLSEETMSSDVNNLLASYLVQDLNKTAEVLIDNGVTTIESIILPEGDANTPTIENMKLITYKNAQNNMRNKWSVSGMLTENQWDNNSVGSQTINNGAEINIFPNVIAEANKNSIFTDSFDELVVDDANGRIKTTWRGRKMVHTIRINLDIPTGNTQFYRMELRRKIDDSVVATKTIFRNPDETKQTIEFTTRTLNDTDPYVIDGFYISFVNNSGVSATLSNAMQLLIVTQYQ